MEIEQASGIIGSESNPVLFSCLHLEQFRAFLQEKLLDTIIDD